MKTQFLSAFLTTAAIVGYVPAATAAMDLTHSFVSSISDTGNNAVDTLAVPSSVTYGHTFTSPTTTVPGSPGAGYGFYDDFVFQISSASANSITSTIDFAGILQINNLQVRLYNATGNSFPVLGLPVGGVIDGWSSAVNYGPTTGSVAVLPATGLSAGTYVLEVRGNVVGAAGGSYSGVLNVAAVPMPAAVWLFGSALTGLISLRRRAV